MTRWKFITAVNTRPKRGDRGGQYGVSMANTDGAISKYRYLLFEMSATEDDNDFGNTFSGEIDAIEQM